MFLGPPGESMFLDLFGKVILFFTTAQFTLVTHFPGY